MNSLFSKILYEMEEGRDTALVSIISEDGSSPRGTGAQMLVGQTGQLLGTIGGGPSEKRAELLALELIREKRSLVHEYHLNGEDKEGLGAVCGGSITVHFQFIPHDSQEWKELAGALVDRIRDKQPGWLILKLDGSLASLVDGGGKIVSGSRMCVKKELLGKGSTLIGNDFSMMLPIGERAIIFGAGHCAFALAPLLQTVGFRVTVFDEREAFANTERYPGAERVICGDYTNIGADLTIKPNDYVVVMTSGHKHDFEVQAQVLRYPMAYCGVIGSARTIAFVQQRLRECGISEEAIQSVHTPIGIPIHSVTPEEIAVSITGEMILERAKLREKAGKLTKSCPMH